MTTDNRISFTREEDFNHHDKGFNPQTAQYLTPILDLLGKGWTAEIYGNRYINLHFNGGKDNNGGFTLYGNPDVTYFSWDKSAESWKYNFSYTVTQSTIYHDQYNIRDNEKVRVGISIDNAKNCVSRLTRLVIPTAITVSEKARQHKLDRAIQQDNFRVNHERFNQLTRNKNYPYDPQHCDSHFYLPYGKNDLASLTLAQYGSCEFKVTGLSVEKAERLYFYLAQVLSAE